MLVNGMVGDIGQPTNHPSQPLLRPDQWGSISAVTIVCLLVATAKRTPRAQPPQRQPTF